MYLTIPVTSATSERTFSALKNYLRSTMKQDHLNNYRLRVVPSRLSRVRWFSLELAFRSLYYSWGKMGTRTTTDWCRDCDKSITDTLDTTKVACAKGILENLSRGMRMAEWKMSPPPPPPPPRFKTLRRLCSVDGKQFENGTFQSGYLFVLFQPFLTKKAFSNLSGLVWAVNISCVVHLFKFLRSPNWRQFQPACWFQRKQ